MEHMCFENTGEPSEVCDQMVKCLLVAKDHCWQNTDPEVAGWLNQAIDNITNGVRQYEEQNQDLQYETSRLTAREQIV
ncbi:hypothetical protein PsorP6_018546 [Peronosclerospora sorghi]|nr:hypothetical protein PsorP6_018495 [Peronosclerospora sorghi]KAI9895211.1 hypothetical protein PsorP6_018546 [Peronosclerospora sorghi]